MIGCKRPTFHNNNHNTLSEGALAAPGRLPQVKDFTAQLGQ